MVLQRNTKIEHFIRINGYITLVCSFFHKNYSYLKIIEFTCLHKIQDNQVKIVKLHLYTRD